MIDLTTYNLIYFRKSDERKFIGKMITKLNRKLIDSVTGEVLNVTEYQLRRDFRPDKKTNGKNMIRKFRNGFKR